MHPLLECDNRDALKYISSDHGVNTVLSTTWRYRRAVAKLVALGKQQAN
uniref:Sigma70_r4_2 domain-containing protein n=1 Tax=Heterorhabditis bacteriophora TaxID=37862 RepID=A0A1I7XFQ8_HETBA